MGDLYVVPLDRTLQYISEVVSTDNVVFVTDDLPPTATAIYHGTIHLETRIKRISNAPSNDGLGYSVDDAEVITKPKRVERDNEPP